MKNNILTALKIHNNDLCREINSDHFPNASPMIYWIKTHIMGLLTSELIQRFRQIGSQENEKDPIIVCKFFTPGGQATWYASEYLPVDKVFMGYVQGLSPNAYDDEWGYFSLIELEAVLVPPFDLPIERDEFFSEKRFSEIANIRKKSWRTDP